MNNRDNRDDPFPLLWFHDHASEIEIASFMAPGGSDLLRVDSADAIATIDAIRFNSQLRAGLVIVESSCRNFDAICQALRSLSPVPGVIIVYPRLRLLGSVFAPPDFASTRQELRSTQ